MKNKHPICKPPHAVQKGGLKKDHGFLHCEDDSVSSSGWSATSSSDDTDSSGNKKKSKIIDKKKGARQPKKA